MNIVGGWRPPLTFTLGEMGHDVSDNVIMAHVIDVAVGVRGNVVEKVISRPDSGLHFFGYRAFTSQAGPKAILVP